MQASTGTGRDRLEARWDEDDELLRGADDEGHEDGADADTDLRAEHKRRVEQAVVTAEQGVQGDETHVDAAELDQQLERAEGEGMVTEHAKVSATDPGPEPLPEPEPEEPEPDHGPEDPAWEQQEAHH